MNNDSKIKNNLMDVRDLIIKKVADFRQSIFAQRMEIRNRRLNLILQVTTVTGSVSGLLVLLKPELIANHLLLWIAIGDFAILILLIMYILRYIIDSDDKTMTNIISEVLNRSTSIVKSIDDKLISNNFQNDATQEISTHIYKWTSEDQKRDIKYSPDYFGKFCLFSFYCGVLSLFFSLLIATTCAWVIYFLFILVLLMITYNDNLPRKIIQIIEKEI